MSAGGEGCGQRQRPTAQIVHAAAVPRPPRRPPGLHAKAFRGSTVIAEGRLTRNELRSTAWRRLFHDVYVCSCIPLTHAARATAAARVLLPGAVVSGRSAALLWGVPTVGDADDVELTVPPTWNVSAVRGVRVRRRILPSGAVTVDRGVRVTTPVVTALDIARELPLDDAVVVLDRLARRALRIAELRAAAEGASGPGCRRARAAVALADGLAESPQETRLRLLLHRSSLPRPVAQHVVHDADGRFVARVDFGWPDLKVAVEYEGRWHGERQNVERDRHRLNRLTAAGWTVVFATAEDLADPARLLARIAAALAASR